MHYEIMKIIFRVIEAQSLASTKIREQDNKFITHIATIMGNLMQQKHGIIILEAKYNRL